MDYYIITGGSRGLGEAIITELLDKDKTIFYLSRTNNLTLEGFARGKHASIYYEECDLSEVSQLKAKIKSIFSKIDLLKAKKITLINNAGIVDPIKNVGDAIEEELSLNVKLNLLAPMIMSEYFINETKEFAGEAVIVNITSGAANRPIAGWSAYCSTKAGLNMFTNTIGLEQGERENKVMAIAFSPGIMDTEMQGVIRAAEKKDFSSIDQFREYHQKGMLRAPSFVANILVKLLSSSLENGRVYDIKEFV